MAQFIAGKFIWQVEQEAAFSGFGGAGKRAAADQIHRRSIREQRPVIERAEAVCESAQLFAPTQKAHRFHARQNETEFCRATATSANWACALSLSSFPAGSFRSAASMGAACLTRSPICELPPRSSVRRARVSKLGCGAASAMAYVRIASSFLSALFIYSARGDLPFRLAGRAATRSECSVRRASRSPF